MGDGDQSLDFVSLLFDSLFAAAGVEVEELSVEELVEGVEEAGAAEELLA
jgi:hypothetical protein